MKREPGEILKDALALPTEARATLAGSLLESLDAEVDDDAEVAWATEVNRRVAELDSGAVKTIPWAEIRPPTRRALMPRLAVKFHPLAADEAEAAQRSDNLRPAAAERADQFRSECLSGTYEDFRRIRDLAVLQFLWSFDGGRLQREDGPRLRSWNELPASSGP